MIKQTISEELLKDLRALQQVEREFHRFTYESARPIQEKEAKDYFTKIFNLSGQANRLRYEIKAKLADADEIIINDLDARLFLKEIKNDKDRLYSVEFYKIVIKDLANDEESALETMPITLDMQILDDFERWYEDFTSWFDVVGYYVRTIKVGPVVAASHLPEKIRKYFFELRRAYSYRLFRSSVVLCRSVLEMSLYDKIYKNKSLQNSSNVKSLIEERQPDKLYELVRTAREMCIIDGKSYKMIGDIRHAANKILHHKGEDSVLKEDDVLNIIRDTIFVLETIYSNKRLKKY